MNESTSSRRRFLVNAAIAATAIPLLARMAGLPASAAVLKKLSDENPQAKALGYVDDAKETKNAAFKPGSACANCQFFTAATGACAIFPGYAVAPKGWCSAWAKKA